MPSAEIPRALVATTGERGRDLFPLDPQVRHLNHGSYGASPRSVLDHQAALKATLESNPMRWFEELPARHAAVREELAAHLHTTADTLAWVPNASAAATVVFSSLDLGAGDQVVLTDHAYGAVAMGVERFVTRRGGRVVRVEVPLAAEADETAAAILAAVGPRTRAVLLDQISSATARHFPVEEVARGLDGTGTLLVIDGAHGLGILECPLVDGDHVIWFGNLHKYACGPRGAAVLSARGEVAQMLWPSIDSWGAGDPFPGRFDLQGSVDSTAFLCSATAISAMEELFGWDRLRAYSTTLGGYGAGLLADALSAFSDDDPRVPLGMPVPQQPLVRLPTGVARDGATARALKDAFAATGFEVGVSTFRGRGYIRVSAHAYSEAVEFDELADRGIEVVRRAADEARTARP